MIVAWRVTAAAQRSKEVRAQEAGGCKGKVHFLRNTERKEHVSTQQTSKLRGYLLSGEEGRRGKARITKEINRGRPGDTHFLETTEGGTSQGAERKRPSERHSLSRDRRGKGKSGHRKESTRARGIHNLETR